MQVEDSGLETTTRWETHYLFSFLIQTSLDFPNNPNLRQMKIFKSFDVPVATVGRITCTVRSPTNPAHAADSGGTDAVWNLSRDN